MNCKHNKPMMCMGVFDNTELWIGVDCTCASEVDTTELAFSHVYEGYEWNEPNVYFNVQEKEHDHTV